MSVKYLKHVLCVNSANSKLSFLLYVRCSLIFALIDYDLNCEIETREYI